MREGVCSLNARGGGVLMCARERGGRRWVCFLSGVSEHLCLCAGARAGGARIGAARAGPGGVGGLGGARGPG